MLEDGAITTHVGNYTAWRTRKVQAQNAAAIQATREATSARRTTQRASGASASTQGRTVDQVELEISEQEAVLAQVELALGEASSAADVARINDLAAQYEAARERLDLLYQQWQELAS
jgi:anti-sigma28 factor (negative regulator of flagellin synthesis)